MKQYTKTMIFLFPLLELPVNLFKLKDKSRLVNCFMYDTKIKKHRENCVFVVIDNYQDPEFSDFEKKLESYENFVTSYDILHGKYSVKIFNVSDKFVEDYKLFLNGKYSEFSDDAKDIVVNINIKAKLKSEKLLDAIFSRSSEAKKILEDSLGTELPKNAEVYGIYTLEKEILNAKILKTLEENISINKKKIHPSEEFN